MKHITLILPITALLTACAGTPEPAATDDAAAVRACYVAYFDALREGKGEEAVQWVDSRTLEHYQRMLELARTADSMSVAGLDPMDRLTVLSLRLQNPDLDQVEVKAALANSINSGLMAGEAPEGLDLGTVTVTGDQAQAPLKLHGFPTPATFRFQRQDGKWHIDLTSLFDLSRMAFTHMSTSSGKDSNKFLMDLLSENMGREVSNSVWHPAGR